MNIEKCIEYATNKHSGQTRKDGTEYIYHPLTVMQILRACGFSIEYQVAGLFHDLLEDTDATEEEIRELSNDTVLEAVKLVTKSKDKSSKDYISDILKNPTAKEVKKADRIHNLTEAKMGDIDFAKRYLENTMQYYYGKFGKELDSAADDLRKKVTFTYTIDSSLGDMTPIYRVNELDEAWVYAGNGKWVDTDPFFYVDLGDNAEEISEEEVQRYL